MAPKGDRGRNRIRDLCGGRAGHAHRPQARADGGQPPRGRRGGPGQGGGCRRHLRGRAGEGGGRGGWGGGRRILPWGGGGGGGPPLHGREHVRVFLLLFIIYFYYWHASVFYLVLARFSLAIIVRKRYSLNGDFFMYHIQHCFICRPSDSTVSEDAGIEPRTVATTALAVRRSNHSLRFRPHSARSHPQLGFISSSGFISWPCFISHT